uniref:Uncharacterized protein n=1 Tax=Rhizophora mucronata TaxID=61149 RepID=A0A2P2IWI4_RHIMU
MEYSSMDEDPVVIILPSNKGKLTGLGYQTWDCNIPSTFASKTTI